MAEEAITLNDSLFELVEKVGAAICGPTEARAVALLCDAGILAKTSGRRRDH